MIHLSGQHLHDIDIVDLIQQYKQYNCLWNYNNPDYKCKSVKQEAWEAISNYFKKDTNEVKRKIKCLRSAYMFEKRKVNASRKSETLHKPSLFYYHEMDFLDSIVVMRNSGLTNIEFENANISQDTEYFENEIGNEEREISCKVERFTESEQEQLQNPISSSPKIVHTRSLARPAKRKINGEIKFKNSVHTRTQSLPSNAQSKNVYISFGNTISLQLQQLPLEVAILTMSEIQAILTKKTLEHIRSLQKGNLSSSHSESEDGWVSLIDECSS